MTLGEGDLTHFRREDLEAMTVRQLRAVGRDHYAGCLGGVGLKGQLVEEIMEQQEHRFMCRGRRS